MTPRRSLFFTAPFRVLLGALLLSITASATVAQTLGNGKGRKPQVKEATVVEHPTGEARRPLPGEWDDDAGTLPAPQRDWVTLMEEDCETLPAGSPLDWDIRIYGADAYWDDWSCWYDSEDESAGCADLGALGIDCGEDYPLEMNSWMVYGPFSLADASDAELNFVFSNNSEAGYDYFKVLASIDDATYYGYQWSGEGQGPWDYSFDLTAVPTIGNLCGQSEVWIAFVFQSDDSVVKSEGAQVDSIELLADQDAGCRADTYEPDDSYSQYTNISSGVSHTHNICPEDDQDWSRFVLSSTSEVRVWTDGASGDTRLWVYDGALSEVAYDDDGGSGAFSDLTATLAAGTYYIKVDEFGNNNEIDSYSLSMTATAVLDLQADVEYLYINGSSVSLGGSTTVFLSDLSQSLEVRLRGENDGTDAAPANVSNLTLAFEQYTNSGDASYISVGASTSSDLEVHTGYATLLDGATTLGGGDQYADYWMVEGWDSGGWSAGESNNLYVDCVPRTWGDFVIHARMGLCGSGWTGCSYDPADGYPGSNPDCLGFGSYSVTVDVQPMYLDMLSPASTVTVTQGEQVLLGYESGAPLDASVSLRYDGDTSWDSGNEGWIILGMGVNGSYIHYWDTSPMEPGTYYIAGMVSQGGYYTWEYAAGSVVIQSAALDLVADVEYITVEGYSVANGGSVEVCLADLSQSFELRLRGENDGTDTSPAENSNLTLAFTQYTASTDNARFSVSASTSSDLTTHTAFQNLVDGSTPIVSGDQYADYWMIEGMDAGGWSSGESNNLYVNCSPKNWGSFIVHYRMGLCGSGWTGCSYDPTDGYPGSNPDCLGFGSYSITVHVTQMYIDVLQPSTNVTVMQGDVISLAYEAGAPQEATVALRLDADQIWDSGNESWLVLAQPVNGSYLYNWNTAGVSPGSYYIAGMVSHDGFIQHDYAPGRITVQNTPGDIDLYPATLEFYEDPQDAERGNSLRPAPPVPDATWDHLPGELILKLSNTVSPRVEKGLLSIKEADEALCDPGVKTLSFVYRSKRLPAYLRNTLRLQLAGDTDLEALREKLAAIDGIEWAEYNYLYPVTEVPDDPRYDDQWHLAQIGAQMAWDYGHGNSQAPIAIIDTGVEWDHTDLAGDIWTNAGEIADNGVDDDGNGYIDDVRGWDWVDNIGGAASGEDSDEEDNDPADFNGHGTHCAGIAAASTDNGIGVAGASFGCPVMALRAGYENTLGQGTVVFSFAAAAIEYAVEHGARVVSLSFGGGSLLSSPITYAFNQGVVVCHAAGNDNLDSPSAIDGIVQTLSVAASDDLDQKASFSNYGDWIDITAPGVSILSTCNTGGYCTMSGTSMACPLTAGAAALLLSRNPALTPTEVMNTLTSTALSIDDENPSYLGELGAGRLDLAAAMASLGGTFAIRNTGAAALTVSSIAPQQNWIELGALPDLPMTLQPGTEQELSASVRWDLLSGDDSGSVRVQSDDPDESTLDLVVLATVDHTAPGAPIDADEDPSSWTNENDFEIEWEDPYDVSGIAAAWYKLGSVPVSDSDGVRITGGDFNVEAGIQGGQSLYLWLEDGRGNRDHTQRAECNLRWDGTSPVAAWTYPEGGESWLTGEIVDLMWSATDSGGSGFVSQPVSVAFSLDGGEWEILLEATENDGMQSITVPVEAAGCLLDLRLLVRDHAGNETVQDVTGIQVEEPNLPPFVVQAPGEIWLPNSRCNTSIDLHYVFRDPEEQELTFAWTDCENLMISVEDGLVEICSQSAWLGEEVFAFVAMDGVNAPVSAECEVHVLPEVQPAKVQNLQLNLVPRGVQLRWSPVIQDVQGAELLFHDGYNVYWAQQLPVGLGAESLLFSVTDTMAVHELDWQQVCSGVYRVTASGTGPVGSPEALPVTQKSAKSSAQSGM